MNGHVILARMLLVWVNNSGLCLPTVHYICILKWHSTYTLPEHPAVLFGSPVNPAKHAHWAELTIKQPAFGPHSDGVHLSSELQKVVNITTRAISLLLEWWFLTDAAHSGRRWDETLLTRALIRSRKVHTILTDSRTGIWNTLLCAFINICQMYIIWHQVYAQIFASVKYSENQDNSK